VRHTIMTAEQFAELVRLMLEEIRLVLSGNTEATQ
jgi:hypothetical protein